MASTHKSRVIFIFEYNNLSILLFKNFIKDAAHSRESLESVEWNGGIEHRNRITKWCFE